MGLTSYFKRKDDSSGAAVPAPAAVLQARARARRRLIGATVLLGIGVIGFPLLFETQPRPIALDIPIEIPRKDTAPPLVLPAARGASAAIVAGPEPVPTTTTAAASSSAPAVATELAAEQAHETAPASHPAAAVVAPGVGAAATPRHAAASGPQSAGRVAAAPAVANDDGARARALLDGKADAASRPVATGAPRIVVQVGAYTDAERLREARQKVERLGLKSYTQVVDADGGRRTRVRVGPFANRTEAEQAASRIKAAGLPAAILVL